MTTASATATQSPKPLTNCAFIAQGVNILRFDPNNPGALDGYGPENIFVLDISEVEPNGQYSIPNGTKYQADPMYEFQSTSYEIKSAAGFSESFSVGASIEIVAKGGLLGFGAPLFSASFSASGSYRSHQQGTQQTSGISAESRAFVTTWSLENTSMALSDSFRNAVAGLPVAYDRAAYRAFIARFGTHFSRSIVFGGRAWQAFLMSSNQYTTLKSQGTNVTLAASVGFGHSVSAGTYSERDEEQWNELSAQSESLTVKYFGGSDLSTWDFWAKTVPNNPLPVGMDLRDVSDLLNTKLFPGDSNIDQKRAAMVQAITDYALEISEGIVVSRGKPTSTRDENVYRFAELRSRDFWTYQTSDHYANLSPTAMAEEGKPVEIYWLERPDGRAFEPLRSGDIVYIGTFYLYGVSCYLMADSQQVTGEQLDPASPSFQWKLLIADQPSIMGEPIAQGTPLLVQSMATGKVMVLADGILKASAAPNDAPPNARMAFV